MVSIRMMFPMFVFVKKTTLINHYLTVINGYVVKIIIKKVITILVHLYIYIYNILLSLTRIMYLSAVCLNISTIYTKIIIESANVILNSVNFYILNYIVT